MVVLVVGEENEETKQIEDSAKSGGKIDHLTREDAVGTPTNIKSGKSNDGTLAGKPKFSEENLASLNKAFALSDICTGRSGKIPATEVANTMRMLGQCPTQMEVNKVIVDVELLRRSKQAASKKIIVEGKKKKKHGKRRKNKVKCDESDKEEDSCKTNKIAFIEFLTLFEKNEKEPETEESIIAAFREFDKKGNGLITTKKLKKIMTGMGEKLSNEEVDEMIRQAECSNGDGKVKYVKFIKMMMSECD